MTRHILTAAVLWLSATVPAAGQSASAPSTAGRAGLPPRGVHFMPNQGQWTDNSVHYGFRGRGADIAFRESSLTMHLRRPVTASPIPAGKAQGGDPDPSRVPAEDGWGVGSGARSGLQPLASDGGNLRESTDWEVLTVSFPGSNPARPRGLDPQTARFNYFTGDDESRWAAEVPSYGGIVYENLYDGIDLHMMSSEGVFKYEFHCAPGADHTQIRIRYEGIDALCVAASGDLKIQTSFGTLVDNAPEVWQEIGAYQRGIPARFRILDGFTYTIELRADADPSLPFVIDPVVEWMTYLGGSASDQAYAVAVDDAGNALVAGRTSSSDFVGSLNSRYGGTSDAFVARVDSSGVVDWMTYLGGSSEDWAFDIVVDDANGILLTGITSSSDFAGRQNSHFGQLDTFVAKLDESGLVQWMTYLGGSHDDFGQGIVVHSSGDMFVTGFTVSRDFVGRRNMHHGGFDDAFVARLSGTGQIQWSQYFGGSGQDQGAGIALDSTGNVLITGGTGSPDFSGRINTGYGNWDAFVLKMSPLGQVFWMVYLGGSQFELGHSIAVDNQDNVFATGYTRSSNFVGRNNAIHSTIGADAFVVKLGPSGMLQWMTYLGGSSHDRGMGIIVDDAQGAIVAGATGSSDFSGRVNSYLGGDRDGFVAEVSSLGELQWMGYLGGGGYDEALDIAKGEGGVFLVGSTQSGDFERRINSYHGGEWDAFLLKLRAEDSCYPDCDENSTLDFFDFLCFQNAFLAGDPYADCDGNGVLDFFDFLCFQNEFLAGCP